MRQLLCFSDLDQNRGPVWLDADDISSLSIILWIADRNKGTKISLKNGECFNVAESIDDVSRCVLNQRIVSVLNQRIVRKT